MYYATYNGPLEEFVDNGIAWKRGIAVPVSDPVLLSYLRSKSAWTIELDDEAARTVQSAQLNGPEPTRAPGDPREDPSRKPRFSADAIGEFGTPETAPDTSNLQGSQKEQTEQRKEEANS